MSMEMIHYKVDKIIDITANPELKEDIIQYKEGYYWLVVNEHVKTWMNQNNYNQNLIVMEKVCDMEKMDQLNPDLKQFHCLAWDFNHELSQDNWVQMHNFETQETRLLSGNQIAYAVLPVIYLKVTQLGVMGSPFVENFDNAYKIMEQYNHAQVAFANIDLFNLQVIQKLSVYTTDKEMYNQLIVENWSDNSFVTINW